MKKLRGLRLGRALVRVCRRLLCRRRRPRRRGAYIRLGGGADAYSLLYASSPTHSSGSMMYKPQPTSTVTGKLWNLCRRPFSNSSSPRWWSHRQLQDPVGAGGRSAGRYERQGNNGTIAAAAAKMFGLDDYQRRRLQQHHQQHQQACKPPKGHLVVYVGKGGPDGGPPPHRVVVPVIYFNHPLFGELLREAEQEYGFHHPGGITIPCPISDFESVRDRVAAASGGSASDLHVRTASGRIWRWHG